MLFKDMLERDMVCVKDEARIISESFKLINDKISFCLVISFSCPISSHQTVELMCNTNIAGTCFYYGFMDSQNDEIRALSKAFSEVLNGSSTKQTSQVRSTINKLALEKLKRKLQVLIAGLGLHIKDIDILSA